ncbi:MAG: ABC transporter permease [Clostridiales bacterium]|nr:ABC transporter permease [Clostridiales bacterium]MCF8023023.1 ABC transporter permease [Clostridiales bacterium]
MILTSLLPNKTLLWKEWKNSRGIGISFLGFITLFSSLTLVNEIQKYYDDIERVIYDYGMHSISKLLSFNNSGIEFGALLFVIALGAVMMGQERERNTFELMLAMPYSRREIIYNKFIVGLGLLLFTFILNAVLMNILIWGININYPFGAADIWNWAFQNVLVLGFVFTFTMLISTASGTTLGNGLLSFIFLFFPMGFMGMVFINADFWLNVSPPLLYRGFNDIGLLLTVPSYILEDDVFHMYNPALIYITLVLVAAGIYKITQYLFSINRMENNGEVLMFHQLEGIFKLGVTICFALLGGPALAKWFGLGPQPFTITGYLLTGGLLWLLTSKIIDWRKAG